MIGLIGTSRRVNILWVSVPLCPIGRRHLVRTCASRLAIPAPIPLLLAACSNPDHGEVESVDPRPDGPVADVSQELTGGNGPFVGAASGLGAPMNYSFMFPAGYAAHEYVAAGTATDYVASGTLTPDGMWTLEPNTRATYRTRVIVLEPADAAAASGTAVVEWLNVSGGLDANPEYASVEDESCASGTHGSASRRSSSAWRAGRSSWPRPAARSSPARA